MKLYPPRTLVFSALCCLHLSSVTLRAQGPTTRFELPPQSRTDFYEGTVVWQQPDGTVLRGNFSFSIVTPPGTFNQPNRLKISASFRFGEPDTPTYHAYLFRGKMDPNGRGVLGFRTSDEGAVLPQPVLDPGKVPVLRAKDINTVSGGLLAPDGTQLIFRGELTESIAPT